MKCEYCQSVMPNYWHQPYCSQCGAPLPPEPEYDGVPDYGSISTALRWGPGLTFGTATMISETARRMGLLK